MRYLRIVLLVLILPLTQAALGVGSIEAELAEIENAMEHYFRDDPRKKLDRLTTPEDSKNSSLMTQAGAFENWRKSQVAKIDKESAELDARLESLEQEKAALTKYLAELKQSPEPQTRAEINAYNAKVERFNARQERFSKRLNAYNETRRAHNARVQEFNRASKKKHEEIEALRQQYNNKVQAYNSKLETIKIEIENFDNFFNSDRDEHFAESLDRLYARLLSKKRSGRSDERLNRSIERLRAHRLELGRYAIRKNRESAISMIIVPAILNGTELCHFVLDTGAKRVTVTPEIVKVLNLTQSLGEDIEALLADGQKTKGPSLSLQSISVSGYEARDVLSMVLRSPEPGIDGLLGRAFLQRFNIKIIEDNGPQLILESRNK